jgi:hypothetical protein
MSLEKKIIKKDTPDLIGHPLLKNFPVSEDLINWKYLSKEEYEVIEDIMTKDVVFFDPFVIEDFYPQEMFDELVGIFKSKNLETLDYSKQMNKWEQSIDIPQKFYDYALKKVKESIGTDDIEISYSMYAHHQITSEGRVPRLPIHIDWSPGSYMIDLHIGGNRDWGFVARYENFITKPNQAIICQPQFDFHYRPSWANKNIEEYYQAFFIHLINKNHWSNKKENPKVDRPVEIEKLYDFGREFIDSEVFINFQNQRKEIFTKYYMLTSQKYGLPLPPWDETPSAEETHVQQKGIISAYA